MQKIYHRITTPLWFTHLHESSGSSADVFGNFLFGLLTEVSSNSTADVSHMQSLIHFRSRINIFVGSDSLIKYRIQSINYLIMFVGENSLFVIFLYEQL